MAAIHTVNGEEIAGGKTLRQQAPGTPIDDQTGGCVPMANIADASDTLRGNATTLTTARRGCIVLTETASTYIRRGDKACLDLA